MPHVGGKALMIDVKKEEKQKDGVGASCRLPVASCRLPVTSCQLHRHGGGRVFRLQTSDF